MSLRSRLTLWSVLLMAAVVVFISAVDLANEIQQQFDFTLGRAELVKNVATRMVVQTLDRQRTVPLRPALRDPQLADGLLNLLTAAPPLVEIAVCGENNEILADSSPDQIGKTLQVYDPFAPVVANASWYRKLRILFEDRRYYQIEQALGAGGQVLLKVQVVVYPLLIRTNIGPHLQKNATVAVISLIGAVVVSLLFSSVAFRPLGKLGHMLDMLARGEFDPQPAPAPVKTADEVGVMASKVSLLGEQLRGARYDVSDLRGNLERLLDELEDAVLIFGRDRRLAIASGAVEKLLGKMREDILGQPLSEVFPPKDTLGLLLAQAVQTGRSIRNRRVPVSRADNPGNGVPVVLLSADLLEPAAGDSGAQTPSGLLVRLRDPEATQQISRRLQMADRLSAISGVTSGVAHEVKNPLNAILMHVEIAKMKLARGDHDLAAHMDTISREILRLDRVVKTFLDFTRPVELKMAEVPFDEFMAEIVELARPQATAAGIEVVTHEEGGNAEIRVDRDLLKQAVLNIVVNAIEAMPRGGKLTFEWAVRGDQAEIRISDTGGGIPPEVRDKIFRLYFTTKKEGTGIGLAMTFRIVQLHDGTIEFSSEPGQGTAFLVRLPTSV